MIIAPTNWNIYIYIRYRVKKKNSHRHGLTNKLVQYKGLIAQTTAREPTIPPVSSNSRPNRAADLYIRKPRRGCLTIYSI